MWTFNKKYNDLEQVAHFLPAFEARLAEIEAVGQYRYNKSFEGHIPGAEGEDEGTAIYLLQGLQRDRAAQARQAALIAEGYTEVTTLDTACKYRHIVLFQTRRMGEGSAEYIDARLIPKDGAPWAILPKGKRTNGYSVAGRTVLVMA